MGQGDPWMAPDACPRPGPVGVHSVAWLCSLPSPRGRDHSVCTPLRACDTHSCRVSLLCACFAGARFHPGDKPQPRGWLSGRFLAPGSQGKAGMIHTCLGRCVCSGAGLNGCDCLAELLSEVLLSICTLTSNVSEPSSITPKHLKSKVLLLRKFQLQMSSLMIFSKNIQETNRPLNCSKSSKEGNTLDSLSEAIRLSITKLVRSSPRKDYRP